MELKDLEKIELELLLEGIFKRYGYDFRHYAKASLKRRLAHRLSHSGCNRYAELLIKVLDDESLFNNLLLDLSITVTEMFRDPGFYQEVRSLVLPILDTYPFFKIWHAGCATGEEAYSLAILLQEADLLDRAQIYATDYNNNSLKIGKDGIYSLETIDAYQKNYEEAGGKKSLSDYYFSQYRSFKIHDELKRNLTFTNHNLVHDGVFGEMNLIFCRNVLIYFDRDLQNQVLKLFTDSLGHRGFLCLGSKESLEFSSVSGQYETISRKYRIFRKR